MTTPNKNQPTTTQYRAQVILPNNNPSKSFRTVSITASSQEDIIEDVNNLLQSKATVQQHNKSAWLFHDSYLNGEEPCGVIEAMPDYPVSLSFERTASLRMKASAGA